MRVIAGKYKRRNLKAVPGNKTRPTTDKNKENMFNLIGPYFSGGYCLDLFAGSGGLGIEALSRGMDCLYSVDVSYPAYTVIKDNFDALGLSREQAQVWKMDCYKAIERLASEHATFDLVLLDPPYAKGFIPKIMALLLDKKLLNDQAIVVVEERHDVVLADQYDSLTRIKMTNYGLTTLHIYQMGEII